MSWLSRLSNVFRGKQVNRDLNDELAFHLEERTEELVRQGIAREEAELQARRRLGNQLLVAEASRDVKLIPWLESVVQDARFGLRMLRKNLIVTSAAVLSLALAIGACTAAFSLIDALILRRLPVADPDRLFELGFFDQSRLEDGTENRGFSYPNLERFRAAAGSQAALFALYIGGPLHSAVFEGSDGSEEKVRIEGVSVDALQILGIRAALGEIILGANDRHAVDHPLAVLSYPFWRRRFGGNRDVLGRRVEIGGKLFQIAGVAAKGFTGFQPGYLTDLWVPFLAQVDSRFFSAPDYTVFRVWGRPRAGHSPEQLREVLQTAFTNFRRDEAKRIFPLRIRADLIPKLISAPLDLRPAGSGAPSLLRWQFQRPLLILGVVALLVLLIACSNVANLFVARAAAREREMAMRLSIGAGRRRLIQQLLVESVLVATAACLLGLALAQAVAPQIVDLLAPADYPAYLDLHLDLRLLGFLAISGVAATLLLGLAPALRASAVSPDQVLKTGGANSSGKAGVVRSLVAVQVGFSFAVLFIAGLLLVTFRNLTHVNLGFKKDGIVVAGIGAKDRTPPDREHEAVSQILEGVRRLPGIERAAMSSTGLVGGPFAWVMVGTFRIAGLGPETIRPRFLEVSPGFFETMQIRLLAGRDFVWQDSRSNAPAAIVNQAFVEQYFSGENPLGQQLILTDKGVPASERLEVVGVVADAKYNNVREPAMPTVYGPLRRVVGTTLDLRTASSPASLLGVLSKELRRVHPSLTLDGIQSQSARIDSTLLGERLLAMLSAFFGLVALALVAIGLYGVLSYAVVRRTKEIGIRIALGARQPAVVRVVIADILVMSAIGLGAGMAGGIALSRFVTTLLFEVKPSDFWTLAPPLACLSLAVFVAGLPPAWRASRVDPMVALRYDY